MRIFINKIEFLSKEILRYWKDTTKWLPYGYKEQVYLPDIDRLIQLTNFLDIWSNKNKNNNIESCYLAYSLLSELTEGWLRLAYSIHYVHCNHKEIPLVPPEIITAEQLIKFSRNKYWKEQSSTDMFIKRLTFVSEYIKNNETNNKIHILGQISNLYQDLIKYQEFIEEIDIRLPY